MADDKFKNDRPSDKTIEIPAKDEQTKAFSTEKKDETGNVTTAHTRQFHMQGNGKPNLERCEERGSIKNYTTWSVIWKVVRPFLILAISAGLVVFLGFEVYNYVETSYFTPVDKESAEMIKVEIKPGSSLSTISTKLFDEGIIRNKFVFQMYVDFNDMGAKLQAGKYELSPRMEMDEIIAILAKGDGGRKVVKVTFTEGMTASDFADTLVESGIFDSANRIKFMALCDDLDSFDEYGFVQQLKESGDLKGRKYKLEGYLFPDTYEFYIDETPENIVHRLLWRFDDIFTLAYEDKAKELDMTIDEIITLASMIEWESRPKDFKKVSAVFHNRIDQEWQLGSDATLRYISGEKKLGYSEEVRNSDSPYNTYKVIGLPIGPITNPGQNAIEAALYPNEEFQTQGYMYFCNKDPESGELAFAITEEEHKENIAMYEDLW